MELITAFTAYPIIQHVSCILILRLIQIPLYIYMGSEHIVEEFGCRGGVSAGDGFIYSLKSGSNKLLMIDVANQRYDWVEFDLDISLYIEEQWGESFIGCDKCIY